MLLRTLPRCEMYVLSYLGHCNHDGSASRYGILGYHAKTYMHKCPVCRAYAGYLASFRLFVENNTFFSSLINLIQINQYSR